MQILKYVQAREEIKKVLSEEQIKMVLTVSGRAREWIGPIAECVADPTSSSAVLGARGQVDLVEQSGMGRAILQMVPKEEWLYLINPSLATRESRVVKENLVGEGRLFSLSLRDWLLAQEIGVSHLLCEKSWTEEEARVVRLLWQKQDSVVEREEIARAMWGEAWSEKYSDWGIDALVHRVRRKLVPRWQIVTVKGRGYLLSSVDINSRATALVLSLNERVREIPGSIYPSDEYLKYMNNAKKPRRVYKDLFEALRLAGLDQDQLTGKILCVNSYSYDNVDSVANWASKAKIYFVHYDPRATLMHQARIRELGLESRIESIYDDLRESKLTESSFDMVINDFRLNFNRDDRQNTAMMRHSYRVLKQGGVAIVSTVVDARYESLRYGDDQEKAPINGSKPGLFQADEHLVRRSWSVPYWRRLFEKAGFSKVREFDIEAGKAWRPSYRRWWMRKG